MTEGRPLMPASSIAITYMMTIKITTDPLQSNAWGVLTNGEVETVLVPSYHQSVSLI